MAAVRFNDLRARVESVLHYSVAEEVIEHAERFWKKLTPDQMHYYEMLVEAHLEAFVVMRNQWSYAQPCFSLVCKDHLQAIERAKAQLGRDGLWLAKLQEIASSVFVRTPNPTVLRNGRDAWKCITSLLSRVKKSVYVMTWAIYDDECGDKVVEALIRLRNDRKKVRVLVGGLDALHKSATAIERLRDGDIPCIQYTDSESNLALLGNHRKLFIVDGDLLDADGLSQGHCIIGGRNIGNNYFVEGNNWHDTDVYLTGPIVAQAVALFKKVWSEQDPNFRDQSPCRITSRTSGLKQAGQCEMMIIDHKCGPNGRDKIGDDDPILRSMLFAMASAEKSIQIANCYMFKNIALSKVLTDAVQRDPPVDVSVLANGLESSEEMKLLLEPQFGVLKDLHKAGVKIYIRDKPHSLLHSKFMIVDGFLSFVGSYNFHPQSFYTQCESVVCICGPGAVEPLTAHFKESLPSRPVRSVNELARLAKPSDKPMSLTTRMTTAIGESLLTDGRFYDLLENFL